MGLVDVQKKLTVKGFNPGTPDGKYGPKTEAALMAALNLLADVESDEVAAADRDVIYQSELVGMFGTPKDPAPYLVVIDLTAFKPHFGMVRDYLGNPWGWKIYGHLLLEKPLKESFQNLVKAGCARELLTYDGCMNIRKMTGGSSWSVHSWGLAVDFNARQNPYGGNPRFGFNFVKCFKDAGFTWGGDWSTPDGMHFQLPRV